MTPTNGTPGYTYVWERVSGDTQISVVPSGATATWSRSLTTIGEWTAVWRCKITDAAGRVAYTPNVTVTFTRENAG